jgi:hypothetical protein
VIDDDDIRRSAGETLAGLGQLFLDTGPVLVEIGFR